MKHLAHILSERRSVKFLFTLLYKSQDMLRILRSTLQPQSSSIIVFVKQNRIQIQRLLVFVIEIFVYL
jgi:hypothetical protein